MKSMLGTDTKDDGSGSGEVEFSKPSHKGGLGTGDVKAPDKVEPKPIEVVESPSVEVKPNVQETELPEPPISISPEEVNEIAVDTPKPEKEEIEVESEEVPVEAKGHEIGIEENTVEIPVPRDTATIDDPFKHIKMEYEPNPYIEPEPINWKPIIFAIIIAAIVGSCIFFFK